MKRLVLTVFILLSLALTQQVKCENILIIVTVVSSYSHRAALEPLAEALADRGHQITFMSPFPGKSKFENPNITEVVPAIMASLNHEFSSRFGVQGLQQRLKSRKYVGIAQGYALFDGAHRVAELVLSDPEYQDFVARATFDLLIVDRLTASDLYYALAWKLKAKLITYSALPHFAQWDHYLSGLPVESSVPVFDVLYDSKEMTFWDRCRNEVSILIWYYTWLCYHVPKVDAVLREGYNDSSLPSVPELVLQEKIMLVNQHYSNAFVQALPPFVIPVGGIGVKDSNGTLPNEVQQFVDKCDNGFVYVSFGTIVTISTLPEDTLKVFAKAFGETKLCYLWKWEGPLDSAPSKLFGKKVMFRNWFPQNEVLSHPKIKGFINQGGQVSISQAVHHGVPMIIFPVNGDQDLNAKRAQVVGNGIPMEFSGLTSTELGSAISKLTSDPAMKQVASRLSSASKKRPMSALDTAVWWTEFVLSEGDVSYLKPLVNYNVPWWSQRQLDVYFFFAGCVFAMLCLFVASLVGFWYFHHWVVRVVIIKVIQAANPKVSMNSQETKLKTKTL